jgi:hypothetical protein
MWLYSVARDDATLQAMKRRTWLKLGLASTAVLVTAGVGVALTTAPGFAQGRLSDAGRSVAVALARGIVDERLPKADQDRQRALAAHVQRLEAAIANFPSAVRAEVSELFMILGTTPGRMGLAGLRNGWDVASAADVQQSLQAMRTSNVALRQQAYHALRDLTLGAYYADAATWQDMAYPGPVAV